MNKTIVLIIFGGASNEHEVSLNSASSILKNIDSDRFEPVMMGITRKGEWKLFNGDISLIAKDEWEAFSTPAMLSPDRAVGGIVIFGEKIETKKIDVILPAMHGQNCEDGAIQGLAKLAGIPVVGCGVTTSAISFDKAYTHIVCEQAGIPMARWQLVTAGQSFEEITAQINAGVGFPCFVKPANSGSSVGCSRADDAKQLESALKLAFNEDRRVIIEELVTAHEVECAVIGNTDPFAPTTGEIVSPDGFYDYEAKYKVGASQLFIPATVSEESRNKVRELAVKIFKILDCRGLSRVDFFVKKDGSVLFNEINTFPGFTVTSMYPKMMTDSTYSYPELVTRLIELAFEK